MTARVAGTDTRAAMSTPTVRLAAAAGCLIAGPAWLLVLGAPAYWRGWTNISATTLPWASVALLLAGVIAAYVGWRRPPLLVEPGGRAIPGGGEAAAILVLLAGVAVADNDALRAAALVAVAPLSGWVVGRAARLAADAVSEQVRSAAAGIVVVHALGGALLTGHLALVVLGSGPRRASGWALFYFACGFVLLLRAGRAYPGDRSRIAARVATTVEAGDAALSLRHVVVTFDDTEVLSGASLDVAPGELVALVGANGAGKSTLLRVTAGLLTPNAGRVGVAGEDVGDLLPEERAASGLAFVSGARPIFPDLTVGQNLRVAAFHTHPTRRSFEQATRAVLALVPQLQHRTKDKAGVLSGGEQRLLAVAQTLYRRPKVLLADELALGLDVHARRAVFDLLRLLADSGVAVIAVDHDLLGLLPRADRAALLDAGTITDFVPATRVLDEHAQLLEATFLVGATR